MNITHHDKPPTASGVDLTMMTAFHAALRRDAERLSRAAGGTDLADPSRVTAVRAADDQLIPQGVDHVIQHAVRVSWCDR